MHTGNRGVFAVLILIIDPSRLASDEMVRHLEGLGHRSIAVSRVEDAVDTLSASLSWWEQFNAIIITADPFKKIKVLWFLRYLNNRRYEYGVIPCLLQSENPSYDGEGDRVDLRTLSNLQFPFVWYHHTDMKKLGYIQTFLNRRVLKKQ